MAGVYFFTRSPNLRIGDDIEVTILSQRGDQFRVGITAPKQVPVHRDEVYQRIKDEEPA